MSHLYIFDIDGTLLSAGRAGTRSIDDLFKKYFNYENICQHLTFAGATDIDLFARAQKIASEASGNPILPQSEIFDAYTTFFDRELQKENTCRAYDGVLEFLNHLKVQTRLVMGIGTGNLATTAQLKLKYSGLDSYFTFGGYGSEHETRAAIFQSALSCGLEQLNETPERIVVFGDTPKDIWAARDVKAEVVAVTTGSFGRDELSKENPDLVVDSLMAPELKSWLGAP